MLKLAERGRLGMAALQPPSGGCVLKPDNIRISPPRVAQPPSGGCVLKLGAAARQTGSLTQPPSGGCVLKPHIAADSITVEPSRLRAAVC